MKSNVLVGFVGVVALLLVGIKVGALPNPLSKPPSFLKFNSVTVKGSAKAPAGQALLADGSAASAWGNVEGVHVASDVAGSPAAAGTVLTADGSGKAAWQAAQTLGATDSPTFAGLTVTNGPVNFPASSIPASSLGSSPIFGNGSDGDMTVSSNATLTRDQYYNNLTVNNNVVLNTNGYRIFVKGTCTLIGVIRNNGSDASAVPFGAGAPAGSLGGGANGGNGGSAFGAAVAGGNGTNALGGGGGAGGTQNSAGGVGGVSTAPTAADGNAQVVNAVPNALTCRVLSGAQATGGAGGGGGGGNAMLGGGGGGGGGLVMLAARVISGTGSIQATGGQGGANIVNNVNNGGGGGGGGGGCVVIVTTSALPATITTNVSGGSPGANSPTTTVPAAAGAAGQVVVLF